MDAELERRLARRAEVQLGLLTRKQLLALGFSPDRIARHRENGRLETSQRSVMLAAGTPRGPNTALASAVLATAGVASHRSAAWLLGLVDAPPTQPEITVSLTRSARSAALVHRSRDLTPGDLRTVHGIPSTTAVRTLIDLGAVVRPYVLNNAVEAAFRQRMITHDRLVRRFFELARRGRPGIGPMRRLLVARDPSLRPAGSSLETLLLRILARHGLPEPERQHEVVIEGHRFFLDVAYPPALIAIEADGFGIHTAHDTFVRDRVRQNMLVRHGWLVLRYTWRTLCDQPRDVADEIAQVLATRLRSVCTNES